MRYSVIIPTYNNCDRLLKRCLESVIKYTDLNPSDIEIIVVANGCKDNTQEYVNSLHNAHPAIKLLWFDEALGYTKSTNEGVKVSTGEYIIYLNDDTVLLEQSKNQWINLLQKPFLNRKGERVGITGPMKEHCPYANYDFILYFCAMISRECLENTCFYEEL